MALCLLLGFTTVNANQHMNSEEIKDKIVDAVKDNADGNGWADFKEVKADLKKAGVRVGSTTKFLEKHAALLESKIDDSQMPTRTLVKLKPNPPKTDD